VPCLVYHAVLQRTSPYLRVRVEEAFGLDKVETREDGSLLVRASCPDNHWMYGMILSYGPDVTVLAPAFVADRIREMGERIALNYPTGENEN